MEARLVLQTTCCTYAARNKIIDVICDVVRCDDCSKLLDVTKHFAGLPSLAALYIYVHVDTHTHTHTHTHAQNMTYIVFTLESPCTCIYHACESSSYCGIRVLEQAQ